MQCCRMKKRATVDQISIEPRDGGVAIVVKDHYADFAGAMTWLIDRKGVGRISYDYTYTGPDVAIRELGIRLDANRNCDEIRWHRWSEWDVFPEDHISRTVGVARAMRDAKWGAANAPESTRPTWPWSLDQTDLGTNDFRAIKFNIYSAVLRSPTGAGVEVRASRCACARLFSADGVLLHVLSRCTLSPTTLKKGEHLAGQFSVSLISP